MVIGHESDQLNHIFYLWNLHAVCRLEFELKGAKVIRMKLQHNFIYFYPGANYRLKF